MAVFVCVFTLISQILESFFHRLEKYLARKQLMGFLYGVTKIKEELMLLGFISLLLVVIQEDLAAICISNELWVGIKCPGHVMVTPGTGPIPGYVYGPEGHSASSESHGPVEAPPPPPHRRSGSEAASTQLCPVGKSSFLEVAAMHQIHILIFIVAITHITLSILTLVFARWTILGWVDWEFWGDDPSETIERLKAPPKKLREPVEFFRNLFTFFWRTVDPFGYICFRQYYISTHRLDPQFNFRASVNRSLEQDFKELMGVSSWMWLIVVFALVAEVWHAITHRRAHTSAPAHAHKSSPARKRATVRAQAFHFGRFYITLIVSFVLVVGIGVKMMYVYNHITRGVMEARPPRAESAPHLRQDRPTSLPRSAHICAGTAITTAYWLWGRAGTSTALLVGAWGVLRVSLNRQCVRYACDDGERSCGMQQDTWRATLGVGFALCWFVSIQACDDGEQVIDADLLEVLQVGPNCAPSLSVIPTHDPYRVSSLSVPLKRFYDYPPAY